MQVSKKLISALEASWDEETSGFRTESTNPSRGQCLVTAMVVQDEYGGRLLEGKCGVVSHFWNELPDGTEVDLTRQQFGQAAPKLEFLRYRNRKDFDKQNGLYQTNTRYKVLRQRVNIMLNKG